MSVSENASVLIKAIEQVWGHIREEFPEVPDVFVTLGSNPKVYGYFAADSWVTRSELPVKAEAGDTVNATLKHELFIGGELLAEGATELFGTLLHEACHGYAHAEGIRDTSRQGRYHNMQFKKIAEDFGLEVEKLPSIGWSGTTVSRYLEALWKPSIDLLDEALTMVRLTPSKPEKAAAKRPALVCECGRKIRAGKTALDNGPIICGTCETHFGWDGIWE